VDGGVHGEKTLGRASRPEPLQFIVSSSHRLMWIFGPIVLSRAPAHSWTPERFAHQPRPRPSVAPALTQHVEDLAFVA
jgi:hypothetical protein